MTVYERYVLQIIKYLSMMRFAIIPGVLMQDLILIAFALFAHHVVHKYVGFHSSTPKQIKDKEFIPLPNFLLAKPHEFIEKGLTQEYVEMLVNHLSTKGNAKLNQVLEYNNGRLRNMDMYNLALYEIQVGLPDKISRHLRANK